MKILVTGGAGFIGSHIVDALVNLGHDVVVVDNISSGSAENVNPRARFYNTDITAKELENIFRNEKFELVNHHAAQINLRYSLTNPLEDAKTNILGTLNMLECCRRFDVKKIVFTSSGGTIYGDPEYLPVDEGHKINPLSPYAMSKYASELYIGMYKYLYGIKNTILRYGNVYGPRQNPHGEAGVIAIFMNKMLAGEPCIVFGDGEQTRDFVHVKDIVRANITAIDKDGIYNIGTGKPTSVNIIVGLLRSMINKNAPVEYSEPIKGEIKHIHLDVSLAKQKLGWNPTLDIRDGLIDTLKFQR